MNAFVFEFCCPKFARFRVSWINILSPIGVACLRLYAAIEEQNNLQEGASAAFVVAFDLSSDELFFFIVFLFGAFNGLVQVISN